MRCLWRFILRILFISSISIFLIACKSQVTPKHHSDVSQLIKPNIFLFVHGAWGGGWEYRAVDSILTRQGNSVYRPTMTGLGERRHLARDNVNLTTHISDIVNVIEFENLYEIILIGHSYGGMVITGVAQSIPERIKHLIYLDAFLPKDGESVKSIIGDETWNSSMISNIKGGLVNYPFGEVYLNPPTDVPHPLATFTEKININNPRAKQIPTSFILMTEDGIGSFEFAANRALEYGWEVYEIPGGHYPMRDQPKALVEKLNYILKQ